MSYIDTDVGDRLRRQRFAIGRSLSEQAAEIGVSEQQLASIEDGSKRASALELFGFCRTLGLRPSDIYADVLDGRSTGHPHQ